MWCVPPSHPLIPSSPWGGGELSVFSVGRSLYFLRQQRWRHKATYSVRCAWDGHQCRGQRYRWIDASELLSRLDKNEARSYSPHWSLGGQRREANMDPDGATELKAPFWTISAEPMWLCSPAVGMPWTIGRERFSWDCFPLKKKKKKIMRLWTSSGESQRAQRARWLHQCQWWLLSAARVCFSVDWTCRS